MLDGVLSPLREARRCRSDAQRARQWAQSLNSEGDRLKLNGLADELEHEALEHERVAEKVAETILKTRDLIGDLETLKQESRLLLAQARELIEKT